MSRTSNLESIIKAAHEKGNTFVYWRCRRAGNEIVFSLEFQPPRKETK